jgi:DNA-directed RNA polymerase subunit RPC12/RpoP
MPDLCARCGASFGSPTALLDHVRRKHPQKSPSETLATSPVSGAPGYGCARCGRTFATAEELAAHDLTPHSYLRRHGRPIPT